MDLTLDLGSIYCGILVHKFLSSLRQYGSFHIGDA